MISLNKVLVIINVYKTLVFSHVWFQNVNNINSNCIICWVLSMYQVLWYIIHFHYFIKSSQCLMKEMWSYPLYRLGNWGFDRLSSPGYLISYGFNLGLSEFRAPYLHSTADLIVSYAKNWKVREKSTLWEVWYIYISLNFLYDQHAVCIQLQA